MTQEDSYKYIQNVDNIGDLPGAEREQDRLRVVVPDIVDANITNKQDRLLGEVYVNEIREKLDISDNQLRELGFVTVKDVQDHLDISNNKDREMGWVSVHDISSAIDVRQVQSAIDVEDNFRREVGKVRLQTERGELIDPATEATLASVEAEIQAVKSDVAALTDALRSRQQDELLVEERAGYKAPSPVVREGEVYHIESGETWTVHDLTVNGTVDLRGTLVHYGEIGGSGRITGDGTITPRSL